MGGLAKRERKFSKPNQSVIRASAILKALGQNPSPTGLMELSHQVGLSPSTVYRLLVTLQSQGLVEQEPLMGKYSLGTELLILGSIALGQKVPEEVSQVWMERLAAEVGENVNLGILYEGKVVYVKHIESQEVLRPVQRVGVVAPAHSTAQGKILLAYLPEEELDKIIKTHGLEARTPKTIISPQKLKEHLAQIRAQGYSVDNEEYNLGIRCLAVPVRNHAGSVIASLSVSGPSTRWNQEKMEAYKKIICEAGLAISRSLGYVPQEERKPVASEAPIRTTKGS